jgi:hypothetical protein
MPADSNFLKFDAMSGIDVLILLPIVPLLPIAITWWLPWEKWIRWGQLPKKLLGPYLLYVAFALWHFKFDWWAPLIPLAFGTGVCIAATWEAKPKASPSENEP